MAIRTSAKKQGVSVAEWVRRAISKSWRVESEARKDKMAKIMAIAERCNDPNTHPTADIEVMLEEIERGRRQSWYS